MREVVARDHEEHGDIRRRLEDPVHLSGAATAVATAQSQVACCTPKHGRLHAEIWPVARRIAASSPIAASPHCRTRRRASLPLGLTHRVKRDRSPRRQGRRRVVPARPCGYPRCGSGHKTLISRAARCMLHVARCMLRVACWCCMSRAGVALIARICKPCWSGRARVWAELPDRPWRGKVRDSQPALTENRRRVAIYI